MYHSKQKRPWTEGVPMMAGPVLCAVALAMLLGGCPRTTTPKTVVVSKAQQPPLARMIRLAGRSAAVVLVLRPGRWDAARRALEGLIPDPGARKRLKPALAETDLWVAAGAALRATGWPGSWPAAPKGWDRRRPLVAGLMSPPPAGPLSVTQAAVSLAPMSFRSRVLVPATDAGLLAGELEKLVRLLGCRPPKKASDAPSVGTTMVCERAQTAVRIQAREDHVELSLLHAGRLEEHELKTAFALDPVPAKREASPRSPALRFMEASDGLLSLYARPWQLRAAYLYLQAMRIPAAVSGADPRMRGQLMALGISELFQLLLATTPGEAELEDAALDLRLEAPATLRARTVVTLSAHGEEVLRQTTAGAPPPGGADKKPLALVRLRHGLDLDRLPKGTLVPGMPPKMGAKVVKRMALGPFLLLRKPLRTLGTLKRLGLMNELDRLTRASEVRVLSLQRARLPDGVVARYEVDGVGLKRVLGVGLPSVQGRVSQRGRALTHEVVVSPAATGPGFSEPWPGAGPSAAPPPGSANGQACLTKLYWMLATLFEGVSSPDPAKRQEMLAGTPNDAKEALACALADPATRDRARGAQAVLFGITLGRYMGWPLPGEDHTPPSENRTPATPPGK